MFGAVLDGQVPFVKCGTLEVAVPKAAEDAMEGRPGGSGAAAARRERLNVTDLEARIRDTMRYHGLIDTAVSFISLGMCMYGRRLMLFSLISRKRLTILSPVLCARHSASFVRS